MIEKFAINAGLIQVAILFLNNCIVFFRRKKLSYEIMAIRFYLILGISTEVYSRWLFSQKINNLYLLHIYTLFEFITWSFFYYRLFRNKKWFQKYFGWFVGIVSGLIVFNTIFLEPITGFNSNAKTLVQMVLIGYAAYYFFDAFGKINLANILPLSISLINFAVLLYYSGSLFIFMFSKVIAGQDMAGTSYNSFWAINALLLVIFQTLIFISLWTVAFPKTKSS